MKLKALLYPWLAVFLMVLVNSSCENRPVGKTINGTVYPDVLPWKRSQIVGLEVTLEDKEVVEYMCFHKDGVISITFGIKGGACCAPVYRWKLNSGRLFITNYQYEPYDELSLVSLSRDTLMARRKNGLLVKYQVHHR